MNLLMKNKKIKLLLKRTILFCIGIYVIYTFLAQQKILNAYKADEEKYLQQIEIETGKKEELEQTKSNINSKEYIEEIARDKLDMYLPNEKVYIDINK